LQTDLQRTPGPEIGVPVARSRPLRRAGNNASAKPAVTIPARTNLKVMQDASMSLYTTMRIGGPADFLVRAPTADDIVAATRWAADQGMPVSIIGGGSNLLVGDGGIRGLVIVARTPGERAEALLEAEDLGTHVEVTVGAQAPLSWVGRYCAEHGWSGMDWGVGLPGQIGGATVNNAGAHGTELKDHLVAVDLLFDDGEVRREDAAWMQPSYRMTRIKGAGRPRPWTLLRSVFRLPKDDTGRLVRLADEHAEFRKRTQPTGACSGSTFANPPGDFAGRLIEAAGLKGHTHGAMQLSPKHANWVMNTGGGTAVEAWELIQFVQEMIRERFGVELRPEIERIGEHQP
jgi:UDP-N-acetylmuramate dehydrogenase